MGGQGMPPAALLLCGRLGGNSLQFRSDILERGFTLLMLRSSVLGQDPRLLMLRSDAAEQGPGVRRNSSGPLSLRFLRFRRFLRFSVALFASVMA